MSGAVLDLALFPLNTVLFPGGQISLHIFEPRYRQMIGKCIRENLPFGIVLIEEGEEVGGPAKPHEIGTVASVSQPESLPDGRYNLVALGLERFRILTPTQQEPYLIARVQLLPDEPSIPDALMARAEEVGGLFDLYVQRLRQLSQGRLGEIQAPVDPEALTWFVAATLPVAMTEKQSLLEQPSAVQRLEAEAEILRRELLFLTRFGALSVEDKNNLLNRKMSLN